MMSWIRRLGSAEAALGKLECVHEDSGPGVESLSGQWRGAWGRADFARGGGSRAPSRATLQALAATGPQDLKGTETWIRAVLPGKAVPTASWHVITPDSPVYYGAAGWTGQGPRSASAGLLPAGNHPPRRRHDHLSPRGITTGMFAAAAGHGSRWSGLISMGVTSEPAAEANG